MKHLQPNIYSVPLISVICIAGCPPVLLLPGKKPPPHVPAVERHLQQVCSPNCSRWHLLINKVLSLNDCLVAPTLMTRSASECWWWWRRRSWPMGSPAPVTFTPWPVQAVTWLQRATCRRHSVGWNRWDELWILSFKKKLQAESFSAG